MVAMHDALQSIVKYFNPAKASHRDDFKINAVQYKGVFGALLACGILSGLTSWFSRIDCIKPDFENVEKRYVEEWCYANSTFVIKDPLQGSVVGNHSSPFNTVVHLRYYQWVTIVLFLQAAGFQIPRLIWKRVEGGRVRRLVERVKDLDFATEKMRDEGVNVLATHYLDSDQQHANRNYFNYFAGYQFLYVINAILQIAFTNAFLGNQFLLFFPMWLNNSVEAHAVFPKYVKCTFEFYGPSGSMQHVDVLCVLAMNTLFEKLYVFIWILLAVSFIAAIYQNLAIGITVMSMNFLADDDIKQNGVRSASDWLLLKFLRNSLDYSVYKAFVRRISPSKPTEAV